MYTVLAELKTNQGYSQKIIECWDSWSVEERVGQLFDTAYPVFKALGATIQKTKDGSSLTGFSMRAGDAFAEVVTVWTEPKPGDPQTYEEWEELHFPA